ncbi:MAG: hypothetical protein GC159_15950 [Phycisphaera sp.]|nr:hypothetical protein [Phycisphaera sp.]
MSSEHLDIDRPIEREPGEKVVESVIGWVAFAAFSPMIMLYAAAALMIDLFRRPKPGNADAAKVEEKVDQGVSHDPVTTNEPAPCTPQQWRERVRMHLMMFGLSLACTVVILLAAWFCLM